jgi:anti-anti-sigma factor
MIGDLRYTGCANFEAFLNRLINNGNCKDIVVDLCDASYLDSTNLGLLARAAGFIYKKFNRKMTLFSCDENINELLKSTGFDSVLTIIDSLHDENGLQELPILPSEEKNMAKMLLEAHRALINLDDKNIAEFKDVVEMLEAQQSQ